MFMTPRKSLAQWMLGLKQEWNVSYTKNVIKKDISNFRPISLLNLDNKTYSTILKNCKEKTLSAIIGENQSTAAKKNYTAHTFYHA